MNTFQPMTIEAVSKIRNCSFKTILVKLVGGGCYVEDGSLFIIRFILMIHMLDNAATVDAKRRVNFDDFFLAFRDDGAVCYTT